MTPTPPPTLACAKYKILTKTPKGRDVDDTDTFAFHAGFVCNLAKIKIQTVANKVETADERKETEGKVEEERNTLCEVGTLSLFAVVIESPLFQVRGC